MSSLLPHRMNPLALAAALACLGAAAQAQTSPEAPPAGEGLRAGETQQIVVTAQKRKEDVRKVPLSVSVLSAEQLGERQVATFSDLTRAVPNVAFDTQAGQGLSTISIRGISSQAGQATVSIYLDDVSLTTRNLYSQGTAEPRIFDVDRIEVLRGPQGTLYGASSLGGTIKYISRQPDLRTFNGYVSAGAATTKDGGTSYELEGVVNVPLMTDRMGLRVGVQQGRAGGYIDQLDPLTLAVKNKDINSATWTVAKLALKADLGGGWSLTPALFAQDYKSNDIDASFLKVGDSGSDYQVNSPFVDQPLARNQTTKDLREPGKDKLRVPSLTVNGDVGFADFTGILAGYKRRFDRTQDGTLVNSTYLGSVVTAGNTDINAGPLVTPDPVLGPIVGALPSAVYLNNKTDQTSIELRLASKDLQPGSPGLPITWVAGLYASRTKTEVFDNEPVFGLTAAFNAAGKDPNDENQFVGSFPNAFPNDNSYFSARHYKDRQTSLFGELTWHLSPTLRAVAGLRVLRASQHFEREGDFYFAGGPTSTVLDSKWHANTPRFALQWDATPEHALYANLAKGFRLGSANRPVPLTGAVQQDLQDLQLPGTIPASFKPDSLWSFELGDKMRLAGGKLLLNAAVFYTKWKDIQQDVVLPVSGYDFETNVGRARSYGAELDARWLATEAITLYGAFGLTRSTFAEDVPALGFSDDGGFNVRKGDWVQAVPRYNASLGGDWRFPLTQSLGAVLRLNGMWVGRSRGTVIRGETDYDRPSYFTANASAGLNWDRYALNLWVKNLNNNQTILQQPSIQSVTSAYRLRPRTIGVTVSADL
jgi:outer membrane receptor protein involved in Fe transport